MFDDYSVIRVALARGSGDGIGGLATDGEWKVTGSGWGAGYAGHYDGDGGRCYGFGFGDGNFGRGDGGGTGDSSWAGVASGRDDSEEGEDDDF